MPTCRPNMAVTAFVPTSSVFVARSPRHSVSPSFRYNRLLVSHPGPALPSLVPRNHPPCSPLPSRAPPLPAHAPPLPAHAPPLPSRAPATASTSAPSAASSVLARATDATQLAASHAASITLILLLQTGVTRAISALGLTFPPALTAMLVVLCVISILRAFGLSKSVDRGIAVAFTPAISLLSRWLSVFFVPNLVMLPLAPPLPAPDLVKIAALIPLMFTATLFSTASVCCGLRFVVRVASGQPSASVEPASVSATPPSNALIVALASVAAASFALAVRAASVANAPARVYALAVTLLTFCVGQRLPTLMKVILHPLVSTTIGTIGGMALLGLGTGVPFATALAAYYPRAASPFAGAGNLLSALLGPAVITFAFTMDRHRRLALARAVEVVGASLFTSIASLFGTAAVVRLLRLAPQSRLFILPRTITAPLAIPIAGMIGADVRMAASVVALTGLIGANIARVLLNLTRVNDPVVRGLSVGSAGHGLGTAAMSDEGSALPFSALAMTLVGVLSTILMAVSPFRSALLRFALNGKVMSAVLR